MSQSPIILLALIFVGCSGQKRFRIYAFCFNFWNQKAFCIYSVSLLSSTSYASYEYQRQKEYLRTSIRLNYAQKSVAVIIFWFWPPFIHFCPKYEENCLSFLFVWTSYGLVIVDVNVVVNFQYQNLSFQNCILRTKT